MIQRNKTISAICLSTAILLSGCGRTPAVNSVQESESAALQSVSTETSTRGLDSSAKDFEEKLTDDTYYVVHDGMYYPVFTYLCNGSMDGNSPSDSVDVTRQTYYMQTEYADIPTLFPGDHLVYYSTSNMLEKIVWERMKDFGYTFPLYSLQETPGGKYYLDFSSNDETPVVEDGSLSELATLKIDNILVDKVGGVAINDSVVKDELISGATEDTHYDLEVYTGTYYKHYDVVPDMRAFVAYELFASTDIDPLQDCFWEIDIPKYFVNGYYDVNGTGLVRILMNDSKFDKNTDFNEQLLYLDPDSSNDVVRLYSENKQLNEFQQGSYPDKLGYVDPDAEQNSDTDETETTPDAQEFKQAAIKEYELWCPKGKACSIVITSKSGESTGSASVEYEDGSKAALTYNRLDQNYTLNFNGNDNKAVLTISGFWHDYNVKLTNAVIYKGQTAGSSTQTSAPVKENSTQSNATLNTEAAKTETQTTETQTKEK